MATKDRVTAAQVADQLRERIASGEFRRGAKLPSTRALRAAHGAASNTVDQAIQILRNEGLLVGRRGSGTYVRRMRSFSRRIAGEIQAEYERAITGDDERGIFEDSLDLDDDVVKVTAEHSTVRADQHLAERLRIDVGAPLMLRTFHYVVDGEPFQIARLYMLADLAAAAGLPATERKGLGSIAHLLNAGVDLTLARCRIVVRRPTPDEADYLAVPAGTSVLERTRTLYAGDCPVEYAVGVVAADEIELEIDVPMKGAPQ